jgi:hypothetical protein
MYIQVPSAESDIDHMKIKCNGLVLMNSAGKIIVDGGLTDTPFLGIYCMYVLYIHVLYLCRCVSTYFYLYAYT